MAGLVLLLSLFGRAGRAEELPGLSLAVHSGSAADYQSIDGIYLFVPMGQPATPFVPVGPFTAVWTGNDYASTMF